MLIIKTQITKDISSYSSISPHVAIARKIQDKGEKIYPGRSIEYVIVKGKGLIRDKAKLPEEVKDGDYDPKYYIEHQIMPALSGIFSVLGFNDKDLSKESSQTGLGKFFN
jgi:DNA polymerase I